MRGLRFDRLMSGVALALPLSAALFIPPTGAQVTTEAPAATASDVAAPSATEGVGTSPDGTAATPATPPTESATAPAETPVDALASLDAADRPIAERLRDLLPKADRTFSSRKERIAVQAFYQSRNYAPLWFDRGNVAARAGTVTTRMQASLADGLVPTDYKLPDLAAGSPDAQAEAELRFTAALITFTRHLQAGRFPFQRMGGEIMLPQEPPNVIPALEKIAAATDVAAAINAFEPPHPGYRALKAKLAELRGATGEETKVVRIPEGPVIRPGTEDARIPLLRQRLNVAGEETNLRYDEDLVVAVRAYQKTNRMSADGLVGAGTLRSLNAVATPRRGDVIDTIVANMERWRWIPRDLGNAHVMLNIPNYTLRVMHNGKEAWNTRVVVGKPTTATPLLTETMKFITINPTWNVPPSIIRNEYLPALAQDPGVLARMGLKVVNNRDGSVHVYQPPGDNNALGRVRFNFPNPFLVYQHDTPDKQLFAHDRRAYSHGCMRVQDPVKYAQVLLSIALPNGGYTEQRIRSLYGPAEHNIQFPVPIPVHITYQTAFVDDAGELQVRPDIYNIDGKTKNLIRTERSVVEPQQERAPIRSAPGTVQRPKAPQQTVGFFESLFGGGQPQQPAAKGKQPKGQQKNQARSERPPWAAFGHN